MCCSAYSLQNRIEYGMIKTTLTSSVSLFSLGVEALFWGLSPQKPCGDGTEFWTPVALGGKLAYSCLIKIIAYSG